MEYLDVLNVNILRLRWVNPVSWLFRIRLVKFYDWNTFWSLAFGGIGNRHRSKSVWAGKLRILYSVYYFVIWCLTKQLGTKISLSERMGQILSKGILQSKRKWIRFLRFFFLKKKLHTRTATKEAVLLPVKSSSDNDPGFRHSFGDEASLPLTQGAPSSISQYYQTLLDGVWSVRMPYPFRCSYSLVLDLFYIPSYIQLW